MKTTLPPSQGGNALPTKQSQKISITQDSAGITVEKAKNQRRLSKNRVQWNLNPLNQIDISIVSFHRNWRHHQIRRRSKTEVVSLQNMTQHKIKKQTVFNWNTI
jgi:hypothetical protein